MLPTQGRGGNWVDVTAAAPCEVCGGTSWCVRNGTALICRRSSDHPTLGRGQERTDKSGGTYWLFRHRENGQYKLTSPAPTLRPVPDRADADTLHKVYSAGLARLPWTMEAQRELHRRGLKPQQIENCRHQARYAWLPERGRSKVASAIISELGEAAVVGVPGFIIPQHDESRYWTLSGRAGLLIPIRDAQGRIVALLCRAADATGGNRYRYLTSKGKAGGAGPGAPVHVPQFDGDRSTVRVTEGALKADLATIVSGVLTIGLPGVSTWKRAADVVQQVGASRVLVAFDADWRNKPAVAQSLERLVYDLGAKGLDVAIETWQVDAGKGIDDLLLSGGIPDVVDGAAVGKLLTEIVAAAEQDKATSTKPDVALPGDSIPISQAAAALGKLLAATHQYFRRGEAAVKLTDDDDGEPILRPLKPATLSSSFETVANLMKWKSSPDGPILASATCPEQTAKLILHSDAFLDKLPPIRLLSRCPVLVEQDGELVQVCGYDRASGVLAFGDAVPVVALSEAKKLLGSVVADFQFATPSDRSRALAAIITPALAHGGLLGGRAPIDLGEADQSQTGKGFRNKLTAAVYRQHVSTITQKRGGVGSLEESFSTRLVAGAGFIGADNIRGRIDSPAIESFMTEDRYAARVPHSADVEIDPTRIVVMFTSNRAEVTPDLANRSSCVRLLKQDETYEFKAHREGDILDHVRCNQPRYLAAVFAVIREWHRQGKPTTKENRHDFRAWARRLDFIVQRILGEAPLLDGHRETQARITNPSLNWLRDVAFVVSKGGHEGQWLRANELLDLLSNSDVEIPGAAADANLDDDANRSKAMRGIGRKIGKCFAGESAVTIDAFTVERQEGADNLGRRRYETRFFRSFPHLPHSLPHENTGFPHTPHGGQLFQSHPPQNIEIIDPCGVCGAHAGTAHLNAPEPEPAGEDRWDEI